MGTLATWIKGLNPAITKTIGFLLVGTVVIGTAVFGIHMLEYQPTGVINHDGSALADDSMAESLRKAVEEGEPGEPIAPVEVKTGSEVFERFDGVFVGEAHDRIEASYPLFISESTAVEDLYGTARLITADLEEVDSYPGLLLSDGAVFDTGGLRSDEEEYRFLKLSNGLHLTSKSFEIKGGIDEGAVPANSLVLFSEERLAYYHLEQGVFVSDSLVTASPATMICLGGSEDETYPYRSFLAALGLLPEERAKTEEPETEAEPEPEPEEPAPPVQEEKPEKPVSEQPAAEVEAGASSGSGEETEPGEGQPAEWVWIKPTASSSQLTPSAYAVSGSLTIDDPAHVTTKPIRYEFWQGGSLYLRCSFTSSGTFTINGLIPEKAFTVRAYLTYDDEEGQSVEECFFTQNITMNPSSSLEPMTFAYRQGAVSYDRIALDGLVFQSGSRELLANAARFAYVIDGKDYPLSNSQRMALARGDQVDFVTPASFVSNSSYGVSLKAYDRFGEVLQVIAPKITATTSKEPPSAIMNLAANEANKTRIGVTLKDKDAVLAGNQRIVIKDAFGREIASQNIDGATKTYTFEGLGFDYALRAEVIADYDLGDGGGLHKDASIGSMNFTTVTISALGYAIFTAKANDLTDIGATLNLIMETGQMDSRLTALITQVKISVSTKSGKLVREYDLTPEEVSRLRTKQPFNYRIDGLQSMTEYQIGVTTGVDIGSDASNADHYDVKTTVKDATFKTLRQAPLVNYRDFLVTKNIIGFGTRVYDKDGVIAERVMVEIRDGNNRLAGEQHYFSPVSDTDGEYQSLRFEGLKDNSAYTVNVIAYNYNRGFSNSSNVSRQVLDSFTIETKDGIGGWIQLRGVDAVANDQNHLSARLRVSIGDLWQEINPKTYCLDVYRNGEFVETIVNSFTGTGGTVDLNPYIVDKGLFNYRFDLRIDAHNQSLILDSANFLSARPIIGISTDAELRAIANDLSASYIALNDIDSNVTYIGGTAAGIYFTGSLDFQGYTLRRTNTTSAALFYRTSPTATVKNMVLETNAGGGGAAGIAYTNAGYIGNVQVKVKGNSTALSYSSYGGICYTTSVTSCIENFAVKFEVPVKVSNYAGGVCYSNVGIVRNGYVYGENFEIPNGLPSDVNSIYVGGAVGYNNGRGRVENVYTALNVVLPTDRTSSYCGLVIGRSTSPVSGVLGVGTLANNTPVMGPTIGDGTAVFVSNSYFFPANQAFKSDCNTPTGIDSLYDRAWYSDILFRSSVDFDYTPVLGECFPQVAMAKCMPPQDLIPLPVREDNTKPAIASVTVDEQAEAYALATISLFNPSRNKITGFVVDNLSCEVLSQFEDEGDVSRVKVRLSNPRAFYSKYPIAEFTYRLSQSATGSTVRCEPNAHIVPAEFYRMISTVEEWKEIDTATGLAQNHRLANDLDFSGYAESTTYIAGSFYGKFDGAGKTLRNMKVTADRGIFRSLYGQVCNVNVDRLTVTTTGVYAGFIGYVFSGAKVDGVHLTNSAITGTQYVGGVVGYGTGADLRNCSVSDSSFGSTSVVGRALYLGGLAGLVTVSTVQSCYAQDIAISIDEAYDSQGIGGLIGNVSSQTFVSNCYATGSLYASQPYLGGLIGYSVAASNSVNSVWSDVSINTPNDGVGGIIGVADNALPALNGLSLGNIYISAKGYGCVHSIVGKGSMPEASFHYSEQRLDGGSTPADASEALTYEQLTNPDTYVGVIGLSGFAYDGVVDGVLPKVLSTEGQLLPGQRDHMVSSEEIRVVSVEAEQVGSDYVVQVAVSHPSSYSIEGLAFDWLEAGSGVEKERTSDTRTTFYYPSMTPLRSYDTYCMTGIDYLDASGVQQSRLLSVKIDFGNPIYKDIYTIDDWKRIPQNTYENYRLMNDLDFTGLGLTQIGNYGAYIGRLDGYTKSDGSKPVIKNLNLTFTGNTKFFIGRVRTSISNIRFDSIALTHVSTNTASNMGIIGAIYGSGEGGAHGLEFSNVTITAPKAASGASMTYVGAITHCRGLIKDTAVDNVRIYGESTTGNGSYFGGLCAYMNSSGTLEGVTATDIEVSGNGSYVGGIVGYSAGTLREADISQMNVSNQSNYCGGVVGNNNAGRIEGVRVQDVEVVGKQYTGALAGYSTGPVAAITASEIDASGTTSVGGILGYGYITASTITGVHVVGSGDSTGGITGVAGNGSSNGLEISDSVVRGASYVGGAFGKNESYATEAVFVIDCDVSGEGNYVGGVAGYSNTVSRTGSIGTVVSGGSNVGGISGSGAYLVSSFVVPGAQGVPSTVYGSGNNVGGFQGEYRYRGTSTANYANVNVSAGGSNVGGLFGSMSAGYSTQVSGSFVARCYFVGSVSGADNVGGLIGYTAGGVTTTDVGLMFAGSVNAASMNARFGVGANAQGDASLSQFGLVRVATNSQINGVAVGNVTADRVRSVLGADSTNFALASYDDMKKEAFWTSGSTGLGLSTTYFSAKVVTQSGVTPQLLWYSYQDRTGFIEHQTPIAIPSYGGEQAVLMANRIAVLSDAGDPEASEEATAMIEDSFDKVSVYASGVSTINIEFDEYVEGTEFALIDGDGAETLSGRVESPVYTMSYDFTTPYTLELKCQGIQRAITIDSAKLARSVMVWGGAAYYLSEKGVESLEGTVVEGSFVNLYRGAALSADGTVYAVADGADGGAGLEAPLSSVAQAVPLFEGAGAEGTYQTYYGFSLVGADETATRPYRFYTKDGALYALSSDLDVVPDAVVFGQADGKEFQTVLGSDGVLVDLGDPLTYPDGFKNEDIYYVSHNIDSASTMVCVQYASGKVVCFDYLTGEELFQEQAAADDGEEVSLFSFVEDFFAERLDLEEEPEPSEAFLQARRFEQEIEVAGPVASGTLPEDAADSPEGTLEDIPEDDGAEDEPTGVESDSGEAAAAETGPEGGGELSNASTPRTGGGFEAPESYVSVWEPASGTYLTYAESDLLNSSQEEVVSQNALRGYYPPMDISAHASRGPSFEEAGRIALFAGIVVAIAGLLVVVYRRQTGKQKSRV